MLLSPLDWLDPTLSYAFHHISPFQLPGKICSYCPSELGYLQRPKQEPECNIHENISPLKRVLLILSFTFSVLCSISKWLACVIVHLTNARHIYQMTHLPKYRGYLLQLYEDYLIMVWVNYNPKIYSISNWLACVIVHLMNTRPGSKRW